MSNANMTGLAWAALVTRWEPEGEEREGQQGPTMVYRLDEPTLEILTHDLEVGRWEAASEYLALAIDEMFEDAERGALVREVTEAIDELHEEESLTKLRELLTTPSVFDQEDTIEEQPAIITEAYKAHGAEVEPSHDGRYVIATCEKCKHKASGPVHAVTDAMEAHAKEHSRKKAKPAPEPTPEVDTEAVLAALMEALGKVAPEPTKIPAEQLTLVNHEVEPDHVSKVVLGVRGNGTLARRSAHVLAELTGESQRELAKLTADEARAFTIAHGISADWVDAASL